MKSCPLVSKRGRSVLGSGALVFFAVFLSNPTASLAGSSNSLMDISADGQLLACTNRDSGTVTIVDLQGHRKRGEIRVGKEPEGITFLGGSHQLAAAIYADDKVVFLDADTERVIGETAVFDEPYGVVSNPSGSTVYVTLEYPGQVAEIDSQTRTMTRTFPAGAYPRGIAISPDARRLFVLEYYTARLRSIDIETGKEIEESAGASTDNLARQIALHPTRPKAYMAHIRSRVTTAHGEGSIFPYVSVVDTVPDGERKRVPMDAFRGNFVVANPWELAISPDGKSLYVVFSGTDDLFACDVVDDDYKEISLRKYIKLGHNPRAVRVAPDSATFYVYNALDFTVVAYDAKRVEPIASIVVTDNPLGEEILRGKQLFYSALQPMVGRRWISCSSCHPDGDADGRTWHNPEGLRATPPLFGLAWTHPLHWSADRDETQDFEHTIRGPLMQGRGLIDGEVKSQLGPPNKGLSADLDAVAAYTNSHEFTLSPHAKNGLSGAAKRGQAIFLDARAGCATCHSGPFYTDSAMNPQAVDKFVRHDVGTGTEDPGEKMGPAYDTPTLLGVYRSAPYLHHGKAVTLAEVFTKYNPNDRHGTTSHLTAAQLSDLTEFIKALPYEDPKPRAEAAGLRKVTR